ncbi:MAG TPA: hypothetical protein PKB03_04595 [Baekduia sp.]|nr:hypothetical protein [Baekduia sp.]
MLRLMNKDIGRTDDEGVAEGRRGVRDKLRYETRLSHPDKKPGLSSLELESDRALTTRLRAVASEAHGIQLLLELARFEPWTTSALSKRRRGRIDGDVREEVITWVGKRLPGAQPDLKTIEKHIDGDPRIRMLKVLGVGVGLAAVGVVTAGVAAPAIGGAIGGAMGLSGAAATSAGLAFLGGGSLAAGGFGMAGGTALLGALGAAGGGGLGAFAAAQTDKAQKAQLAFETKKLRALIHLCAEARSKATRSVAVEQQLVIESEIARLISTRVDRALGKPKIDELLEQEIADVAALRDAVGVETFPLEPC